MIVLFGGKATSDLFHGLSSRPEHHIQTLVAVGTQHFNQATAESAALAKYVICFSI